MHKIIRYIVPFIPIIGIIIVLKNDKPYSWLNHDEFGNEDNPLNNNYIMILSLITQICGMVQLFNYFNK